MMYAPCAKEFAQMTFQLGLQASDGIVLASDRLFQDFNVYGERDVSYGSKFLFGTGVVCCYSGDKASEYAANRVRNVDWASVPNDTESIRECLKACGRDAWKEWEREAGSVYPAIRKVIVVCWDTLWLLEVSESSLANRKDDRVVAGDAPNTSRHIVNRYAEGCQNMRMDRLVSLVAHAVICAGDENPHGVGGLEVVLVPKGGAARALSAQQEKCLRDHVVALGHDIRERLLAVWSFTE
jgi:hypothetical protein